MRAGASGPPLHSPRERSWSVSADGSALGVLRSAGNPRPPRLAPTWEVGKVRLLAVLPADSRASDLLVGQAGVERDFGGQGFECFGG